ILVGHQVLAEFAGQTSGKPDQSLGVLRKKLLAHSRLVIHAMQRSLGGNLYEVSVTFIALGQYQEVVVLVTFRSRAMVIFLADVELTADDRLHPGALSGVIESHCAEDVAMIGHGN